MEATPGAATTTQMPLSNGLMALLTPTDDSTRMQKNHLRIPLQVKIRPWKVTRAWTAPQHMKQKRCVSGSLAHPGPEPRRTTIP